MEPYPITRQVPPSHRRSSGNNSCSHAAGELPKVCIASMSQPRGVAGFPEPRRNTKVLMTEISRRVNLYSDSTPYTPPSPLFFCHYFSYILRSIDHTILPCSILIFCFCFIVPLPFHEVFLFILLFFSLSFSEDMYYRTLQSICDIDRTTFFF